MFDEHDIPEFLEVGGVRWRWRWDRGGVYVDLGAGTAGTCDGHLPEVVLEARGQDVIRVETKVEPGFLGFQVRRQTKTRVTGEVGDVEAILGDGERT